MVQLFSCAREMDKFERISSIGSPLLLFDMDSFGPISVVRLQDDSSGDWRQIQNLKAWKHWIVMCVGYPDGYFEERKF
uniref:Uncharacterized protein n=1 Tax=Romanomermis culicivorax TaxID=13658 RepID=A0A915JNE8_ROMCU